jgi:hypothetical protein
MSEPEVVEWTVAERRPVPCLYAIELRWGVPRVSLVWQFHHERSVYTCSHSGESGGE